MVVKKLVWKDDYDDPAANSGWIPEELSDFDGLAGMRLGDGIAHDLIEHTNTKNIATFADEIRAAGVMIYTRIEGGFSNNSYNRNTSEQNISSVFHDITRHYMQNRGKAVYGAKFPKPKDLHNIDNYIEEIMLHGIESYLEEIDGRTDYEDNPRKAKREYMTAMRPLMAQAPYLMRAGYAWADKRYRSLGGWRTGILMENIKEKFNNVTRYSESSEEYEQPFDIESITVKYSLQDENDVHVIANEYDHEEIYY